MLVVVETGRRRDGLERLLRDGRVPGEVKASEALTTMLTLACAKLLVKDRSRLLDRTTSAWCA